MRGKIYYTKSFLHVEDLHLKANIHLIAFMAESGVTGRQIITMKVT